MICMHCYAFPSGESLFMLLPFHFLMLLYMCSNKMIIEIDLMYEHTWFLGSELSTCLY